MEDRVNGGGRKLRYGCVVVIMAPLLHMEYIEFMTVRIGEYEPVIPLTELFRFRNDRPSGLPHALLPPIDVFHAVGGKREDDLVSGGRIDDPPLHGRLEHIIQEEMDDELLVAEQKARQLIRSSIVLESNACIEFRCPLQIADTEIGPYAFGSHRVHWNTPNE